VFDNVLLVFDELIADELSGVGGHITQLWDTVNNICDKVIAVKVVSDKHIERRSSGALFFVPADVNIMVVGPAVSQSVYQPGVSVIGEYNGFVRGKKRIEFVVGKTVRMLFFGLKRHKVNDIYDTDFQVGDKISDDINGGKRLKRGYVAAARHYNIRLPPLVVACPFPDTDTRGAVFDGLVHIEPLWIGLFSRHNNVYVISAAQAMVGNRQQRIGVRRKIYSYNVRFFVHHMVDEAGVLMAEAVMVLPPDVRGQKVIKRGDWPSPRDFL